MLAVTCITLCAPSAFGDESARLEKVREAARRELARESGSFGYCSPRAILQSRLANLIPVETIRAIVVANYGIDPINVERAEFFGQFFHRSGTSSEYGLILHLAQPMKLS